MLYYNKMQTLRKRLSYDEMVDYVENDTQRIKFPNRQATFLRNSPFLSQFDGESFISRTRRKQNE